MRVSDVYAIDLIKSNYIRELISKGKREDSRGLLDFRAIKIKPGIIQNAEGSAQVDLGNTRVLAGVKMGVGEPMEDTPDMGTIAMSAELLPAASADYETGPPSPESIELARVVDRGIRAGNCVDLSSLLIDKGKCWNIFVDIYVLNYDGNLFDASCIAAMSSLVNTKVPGYEDEKELHDKRVKNLKIDNIVTSATFGKIGKHLVLDPDRSEENAMLARFTVATDGKFIRAMQKGLSGSLYKAEIESMVDTALEKHKHVKKIIEESKA